MEHVNTPAGTKPASSIDRRTAMKAALGGATAAAVLAGPKIKGMSLVPDYAAAASGIANLYQGTLGDGFCNPIGNQASRFDCWGSVGIDEEITDGDNRYCIPADRIVDTSVHDLTFTFSGSPFPAAGGGTGYVTFNVHSFMNNAGYCTVTRSSFGNCSAGTASPFGGPYTLAPGDPSVTVQITCEGAGCSQNGALFGVDIYCSDG